MGTCKIVGTKGPLTRAEFLLNRERIGLRLSRSIRDIWACVNPLVLLFWVWAVWDSTGRSPLATVAAIVATVVVLFIAVNSFFDWVAFMETTTKKVQS